MLNVGSKNIGKSIQLWLVHEREISDQSLLDQYLAFLGEREKARFERLKLPGDKKQFLITQVLARTVLAELLGMDDPGAIRFERNPYGKPYLSGNNPPQFNLTNSNGLVALAVTSDVEVGIDVEYVKRKAACLQLARRYFTSEEAVTFEDLEENDLRDRFFDFWTLKEAWLKAYGTGLRTPLDTFGFAITDTIEISFTDRLQESPQGWSFWQFDVDDDYRLSLCLREGAGNDYDVTAKEGIPLQGFKTKTLQQRRPPLSG